MVRKGTAPAIGLLLLPQIAWASDYSGLLPFYVAFVMFIGGLAAGLEWTIIAAAAANGAETGDEVESEKKGRFGCGFGAGLWLANSVVVHVIIVSIWG